MLIEIFEIKNQPDVGLDKLILLLSRSATVKKINVLDKETMKKHQDVIQLIKKGLPVIKVDGKVSSKKFLESITHNI